MTEEQKSPVSQALEIVLYAPLGLALTAREQLPRMVEKGRQQVNMYRFVGEFAVRTGRKEADKLFGRMFQQAGVVAERMAAGGGVPSAPAQTQTGAARRAVDVATSNGAPAIQTPSQDNGVHRSNGGPEAAALAIPAYDTLSASQVVQRLGGLSPAELAEVGRYEDAHRGRRTILSKVAQLQADQP